MAHYIGRWDCSKCGATAVWGTLLFCPDCGASAPMGGHYLPKGEPPITDEEARKIVHSGPHWACEHCTSPNYGNAAFCTKCGAPKGSSPSNPVRDYGPGEVPTTGEEAAAASRQTAQVPFRPAPSPAANPRRRRGPQHLVPSEPAAQPPDRTISYMDTAPRGFQVPSLEGVREYGWQIALGIVIVLAALVAWLVFRPFNVDVTIDRFEWSRTIHVQQYMTVREGDWSIPTGGRYVSQASKIHHYESEYSHTERRSRDVVSGSESYDCGTRDNGDGTFSDITCSRNTYSTEYYDEDVYESVPKYRPYYTYDIERWVPSRNVVTGDTGRFEPAPHWGDLVLACANQARIGCESERGREEHYTVVFEWPEGKEVKQLRYAETQADWDAYDASATYTLVMNGTGAVLNDPLRPEAKK